MSESTREPPAFLSKHYADHLHPTHSSSSASLRPHITVTWAQSLDAKIAGPGGARVLLSGSESMEMTHWLRSMHDAILIGINTLIMDDPRLRIQLLPQDGDYLPPRPLILDPKLRIPLSARILQPESEAESSSKGSNNSISRVVRLDPWIICGEEAAVDSEKKNQLERLGARLVPVKLDEEGRIPPTSLPEILSHLGLKSVMIEGGSRILSAFLHAPQRQDGSPLVDSVVVTVAPTFIGEGVGVVPEGEDIGLPPLKTVHTETMGKDSVMVATIAR